VVSFAVPRTSRSTPPCLGLEPDTAAGSWNEDGVIDGVAPTFVPPNNDPSRCGRWLPGRIKPGEDFGVLG